MPDSYLSIGYIVILVVLMYFFLFRPQQKREKQAKELRNSLQVGDKVITIGGVVGNVVNVSDDDVTVVTSVEKTQIVFVKSAISEKVAVDSAIETK